MAVRAAVHGVNPIGDTSRPRRLTKVVSWLVGVTALLVVLNLFGIEVSGWLRSLWDVVNDVSAGRLASALVLQTLQTSLTALAWLMILQAAYPHVDLGFGPILTAYAVGVALNGVLPANLGTLVMLFMFVAIISGAAFAGVFSGYLVHKIFFTLAGGAIYLYLFLSVGGTFSSELGLLEDHRVLAILIPVAAIALVALLVRAFWPKLRGIWNQAKQGASVLGSARQYFLRVFLPSLGAYVAKFGVIAVFLGAYGIPVTFHTMATVVGGNSLANVTSVTPGGVGVNQAVNAAALSDVTDPQTATAYSISQQLITTAWNIAFAVVLVVAVFGWAGGRALVKASYADARERAGQMRGRGKEAEA